MSASALRVLIVEDEAPARRTVRDLLARASGFTCVGEAWASGALDEVRELDPDIVLLDVRMPGMDGFEIIRTLESERGEDVPVFVVVTAHEEHAVEAFEVRAIDYLLKPFTDARFFASLDRAAEAVRSRDRGSVRVDAPVVPPGRDARGPRRLLLEESGATTVVPVEGITWVEASGPYVVVHAQGAEHLSRRSLSSVEHELSAAGFARVHRSALVNVAAVRSIRALSHGDAVTTLSDGSRVRVSRSRREAFETLVRALA